MLYWEQGVMYPPSRELTQPQRHLPYPSTLSEESSTASNEKIEEVHSYILHPAGAGPVQSVQAFACEVDRMPSQNEPQVELTWCAARTWLSNKTIPSCSVPNGPSSSDHHASQQFSTGRDGSLGSVVAFMLMIASKPLRGSEPPSRPEQSWDRVL